MALDDHDQLQNDNWEIDVGGTWASMETRGKKKKKERRETESIHYYAFLIFVVQMLIIGIIRKFIDPRSQCLRQVVLNVPEIRFSFYINVFLVIFN